MNLNNQTIQKIKEKVRDFLHGNADKSLSVGANSFHFFYQAPNGQEYVVLIPKYEKVLQGYKKQEILLPFLQRLNLPVSIPTGIMIVSDDNLTFAIEEKMNGFAWDYTTYANFSRDQQRAFSKQIATFLFSLHQTPTDNLPDCSFDDFFVFPDKETFHKKLSFIFPDEKDIDRIYEKAKIIFEFGSEDTVFMHRDFHPQNTFVDKAGNLSGVIDWAACCIAPRIREFQNLAGSDDRRLLESILRDYNALANTNILPEQVVLFNHIEWITCLDIMKDRPSLLEWAKKDGALLASGKPDKQIDKL